MKQRRFKAIALQSALEKIQYCYHNIEKMGNLIAHPKFFRI